MNPDHMIEFLQILLDFCEPMLEGVDLNAEFERLSNLLRQPRQLAANEIFVPSVILRLIGLAEGYWRFRYENNLTTGNRSLR